jgi:mRNA interferase HicA
MKRRDLLRHLRQHRSRLVREGGELSIWENPVTHRRTSVPRHNKILEFTVARICKQLGVPVPA